MKKFKCVVTRTDEYEIEFDENIINDEFMKEFKEYMCNFDTLEEHAENIAQFRARFGERFIEGYGYPKVNGEIPFIARVCEDELKDVNQGINIKIISEDQDCDVDVEEIV